MSETYHPCLLTRSHLSYYLILTHWSWDKMAPNFLTTFSNAFFYWNVIISIEISPRFVHKVPINNIAALVQIWLRADQATSHYLNQWWLDYRRIYVSLGLSDLIETTYGSLILKAFSLSSYKLYPYYLLNWIELVHGSSLPSHTFIWEVITNQCANLNTV